MTDLATTVRNVRRLLSDEPLTDVLNGAIVSAAATTMTVTDVNLHAAGTWWEFQDDTGDIVYETAVNPTTSVATVRRNYLESTATTHADQTVMAREPRNRYDVVAAAVNMVLDADLFQEGVFALVDHQITSSASTNAYNAPSENCETFLNVYQKTATMSAPDSAMLAWSPLPTQVDTSLYANGKFFTISGNYGTPGTDTYYVTCAHKLDVSTLNSQQERIVHLLAAAYCLEWREGRRLDGPTNQGDQTVKPGAGIPTAAYYRQLAEELMTKEATNISHRYPKRRRFIRN